MSFQSEDVGYDERSDSVWETVSLLHMNFYEHRGWQEDAELFPKYND